MNDGENIGETIKWLGKNGVELRKYLSTQDMEYRTSQLLLHKIVTNMILLPLVESWNSKLALFSRYTILLYIMWITNQCDA